METDVNTYKYGNDYFDVEEHYLQERPYIVLSFGDTSDSIFDEALPFPYDLPDEELINEVKYSLGIEAYPKV